MALSKTSIHNELTLPTRACPPYWRGEGLRERSLIYSLPLTGQAGFTLTEILVVLGIIVLIATFGLIVSLDVYKSYAFRLERSIIVSTLQKARSQSLNNINQVRHGVRFQTSPLAYVLFECPSGTPQCKSYTASASDLVILSSYSVSIDSPTLPFDVIFDQLSGDCVVSTGANAFNCDPVNQPIKVSSGNQSFNITVNSAGQINW